MLRFLIVVIVYALAVISLPRWEPFAEIVSTLSRITPGTALIVNLTAIGVAGAFFHLLTRKPGGWIHKRPSGVLEVFRMGLVGILFAAVFDLFQGWSGYTMGVKNLTIIPLAFIVAEAVYVLLHWIVQRIRGTSRARDPSLHTQTEDEEGDEDNNLLRYLITLPIYAFVVLFLPRQDDFRRFADGLVNITPSTGAILSGVALAVSLAASFYIVAKTDTPALTSDPAVDHRNADFVNVKVRVFLSFWLGLAFAGLINLAGYAIGAAPYVQYLIIIPIGTFAAELIYRGLAWRIKYGPPEV